MPLARRLFQYRLIFGLALPAFAQDMGAGGAAPAAIGGGDQASSTQIQPVAIPQVQSPDNTLDRSDFQEFIAQSTGQRLPLFGHNLFAGVATIHVLNK